jgi:hypothetical protein
MGMKTRGCPDVFGIMPLKSMSDLGHSLDLDFYSAPKKRGFSWYQKRL